MRREIRIRFDKELAPELYADIASAVWMQMRAVSGPGDFNFDVYHDGTPELADELNAHWDRFADDAQWGESG
ncbi:hypothetical protein [Nocardia aurea]|uniref:hypothetical protein n=1 Tax=Nocardia aurea TaxID=2144174 RepID=UPI000D688896|nr:hypothetical protein [Nocardia aurea]